MIEYDKNGNPSTVIFNSGKVVNFSETVMPPNRANSTVEPEQIGKYKVIPWFDGNDYPAKAALKIKDIPSLKRAIITSAKIALGQGIFPCLVTGYNSDGSEILQIVNDPEIFNSLQSYVMRRYLAKTEYDIESYGNAFVQLVPNVEGTKIVNIVPVAAGKCRLHEADKDGVIKQVLVTGDWADTDASKITPYILLDEIDPFGHLLQLKDENQIKGNTFFMHLKNPFSSNDYYALPNCESAVNWIPIAQKVPKILNAGIDNVLNIFFVINIPYSYWDRKYPKDEYSTEVERRALIESDIARIEDKFTSAENAKKALITFFGAEEGVDDKWEIKTIETKFNQENFVTSTAADTQISIAQGINPDLLGLMYGNSKGGSMQRELLLLQYALSWHERQLLADPIEMMLRFNGADEAIQIRFRNTFLTTLDTGSGTAQTLS